MMRMVESEFNELVSKCFNDPAQQVSKGSGVTDENRCTKGHLFSSSEPFDKATSRLLLIELYSYSAPFVHRKDLVLHKKSRSSHQRRDTPLDLTSKCDTEPSQ
jgi:hypothetical protein